MKAILVDDVENSRIALRSDLEDYCKEVSIVGEASGVVDGVKLIHKVKPDLVFLDIEMGDGNGFDLLEMFETIPFQTIFITGMDNYAIKAFKYSAVDYLLKPVDPADLEEAVKRAQEHIGHSHQSQYEVLKESVRSPVEKATKLALHSKEKVVIANISDILRCESDDNYTRFHLNDGRKLLISKTLKEYDGLLSEHGFLRVHQSHLVNPEYIKEYVKVDGGHLLMPDGKEVPIAHRRRDVVNGYFEGLG